MGNSGNTNLHRAKDNKQDEFYTTYEAIQSELNNYEKHFEGKTVLCNADDPFESNFCKFFLRNFNYLKLKRLICTSYNSSPVAGTQLSFFDLIEGTPNEEKAHGYVLDVSKVPMANNRGVSDADIDKLLRSKKMVKELKGDGDFRSDECVEYLKQADIVVTNPPFSLFREYVALLIEYDKKFLIIGNQNAITYKEIFPLLQDNKMWLGTKSGDMSFRVPDYYEPRETRYWQDETGQKWRSLGNACWYTNLDHKKRHEKLVLYKTYTPEEYPHYDNYDAVEVPKITDIPIDYGGNMGVPITFLDKYNPEQFEIVGFCDADSPLSLGKDYSKYIGYKQDRTLYGRTGSTFGKCPVIVMDDKKHPYYEKDGIRVQATYHRVFIRKK